MASKTANRRSAKGEYIETDTGNKVSRRASIAGTPHIILAGRVVISPFAILRGDLVRQSSVDPSNPSSGGSSASSGSRTALSIARYTFIAPHATLHPPHRVLRDGSTSYYAQKIESYVYISSHAFIQAASIGSNCHIGEKAVIGNGCVLKDGCKVVDGAVLPDGMVVPPNAVVAGCPARIVGEVGVGWGLGGGGGKGDELYVEGGELRELCRSIK